ncbi:hypothetical protein JOC86_001862 [Bacillus pakistanensis]|uniref:Uncharacterized protein n=1 Tax=Rossellomorea pakistanensis TaxID=992288 RepID=A0ABS2NBT6_9BACI|nr:hypothetical protein [Bacillus pakistanensis]
MKKKLYAVIAASFLVFGLVGAFGVATSSPSLQSELPDIH